MGLKEMSHQHWIQGIQLVAMPLSLLSPQRRATQPPLIHIRWERTQSQPSNRNGLDALETVPCQGLDFSLHRRQACQAARTPKTDRERGRRNSFARQSGIS